MEQPIYREVQHFFRQWIFLLPIAAVTVIVWYEFVQQVVLGNPQGEQPIPNGLAWALTVVFGLGFPVVGVDVQARHRGAAGRADGAPVIRSAG